MRYGTEVEKAQMKEEGEEDFFGQINTRSSQEQGPGSAFQRLDFFPQEYSKET